MENTHINLKNVPETHITGMIRNDLKECVFNVIVNKINKCEFIGLDSEEQHKILSLYEQAFEKKHNATYKGICKALSEALDYFDMTHYFDQIINAAEIEEKRIKINKKDKIIPSHPDFYAEMKTLGVYDTIHNIALWFIENYHFKTIIGKKNDKVYLYKDGIYEDIGISLIREITEQLLNSFCRTNIVNEVIEKIKRLTIIDNEELDNPPPHLLCLENGIYDIETKTLHKHSHNKLFINKIPLIYDKNATCPIIEKFLNDIFYKEDIILILEWFGFCLYRSYFIKKALILEGAKNTGKSTFLSLLGKFIGEKNISGISLQKLAYDKFARANLFGKMVNIYDDLSYKEVADTGSFKIATGNGIISGEKKFGDEFTFRNYSKLTYATNRLPETKDLDDDAYFDRFLYVRCDRVFSTKNMDNFLIDKLTTQQELSGLLNLALKHLENLLQNKKFSYDKNSIEIKDIFMKSSSAIASFVLDCLERDDNYWLSKDDMYDLYTDYCAENSLARQTKEKFGRDIQKICDFVIDSKKIIGKKRVTGWRNARPKNHEKNSKKNTLISDGNQKTILDCNLLTKTSNVHSVHTFSHIYKGLQEYTNMYTNNKKKSKNEFEVIRQKKSMNSMNSMTKIPSEINVKNVYKYIENNPENNIEKLEKKFGKRYIDYLLKIGDIYRINPTTIRKM